MGRHLACNIMNNIQYYISVFQLSVSDCLNLAAVENVLIANSRRVKLTNKRVLLKAKQSMHSDNLSF